LAVSEALLNRPPEPLQAACQARMRALRRDLLFKRLKATIMFTPLARRLIMRSGLHSLEIASPRTIM